MAGHQAKSDRFVAHTHQCHQMFDENGFVQLHSWISNSTPVDMAELHALKDINKNTSP